MTGVYKFIFAREEYLSFILPHTEKVEIFATGDTYTIQTIRDYPDGTRSDPQRSHEHDLSELSDWLKFQLTNMAYDQSLPAERNWMDRCGDGDYDITDEYFRLSFDHPPLIRTVVRIDDSGEIYHIDTISFNTSVAKDAGKHARDTHGDMTHQALVNWMANTLFNQCYVSCDKKYKNWLLS